MIKFTIDGNSKPAIHVDLAYVDEVGFIEAYECAVSDHARTHVGAFHLCKDAQCRSWSVARKMWYGYEALRKSVEASEAGK